MEFFQNILLGFQVVLDPTNLLLCFIGVVVGTMVGVLPGIGPVGAMALLLPATFKATPTSSIIMLAGIYYGAMYGGSTTSILVNIPGEAASVVTCLDGYQMARQGRAGPALGMAAMGSFIAGTLSVIGLMWIAHPLARGCPPFWPPRILCPDVYRIDHPNVFGPGFYFEGIDDGSGWHHRWKCWARYDHRSPQIHLWNR